MLLLISSVAHDTVGVNKENKGTMDNVDISSEKWGSTPQYCTIDCGSEKEEARQMTIESQRLLLQIARDAIACHLEDRKPSKYQGLDAELLQKSGAFVTLHKAGQLRGCVDYIVSNKPLYETIAEAAVAAATRDPRFHRLNLSEMPTLAIEISVLTPLQPLKRIEDLEIGVHGLYIKHGVHSGLLLPQVATAHNWNRTRFLQQICKKAQLSEEAWQNPKTEIYLFSTQVFGEAP